MKRVYVFSDEAGCLTFKRDTRASRYFLVCTVTLDSCTIGDGLLNLRRDMVWRGLPVGEEFHASEDRQEVRNEVFAYIGNQDFRADATLLEKSKCAPEIRSRPEFFYKHAWHHHFVQVGPEILPDVEEAHITAAALGTRKGQAVYTAAVNDVCQQAIRHTTWRTCFPRAVAEPCLQVADYCAWAILRKWERGDERSYDLIRPKIRTETDLWQTETIHYF